MNPERVAWLARLGDTVREVERQWSLTLDDPFAEAISAAWVAPARLADGTRAVLKVAKPHMEAEHEIHGLRFWDGGPIVRLIAANDRLGAMLLERCEPGTPLRIRPEPEQDVVIAGILRRLWRAPEGPHVFRPLSVMTAHWSAETVAASAHWADPGLVREGLRLFRDLPKSAGDDVLLTTDLHAGNVLQAEREPCLAIDPKPFVGERAYDATQHLLNCDGRLRSNPRDTIRRFADLLEVCHERVQLWTFARAAAEPRETWNDPRLTELARALAP